MHGEFHATVISFVQEREQREESNRTRGQTKIGSLMIKGRIDSCRSRRKPQLPP